MADTINTSIAVAKRDLLLTAMIAQAVIVMLLAFLCAWYKKDKAGEKVE